MISTLIKFEARRIFGNVVFQDQLILELRGLRHDQVLIVGCEFGFGSSHVQRGHGTDFQLLLVVVVEFCGYLDGFRLHLDIFPGVNEFPVRGNGVRYGGDRLLRESQVGDLAIVFGNEDIPPVYRTAESLK